MSKRSNGEGSIWKRADGRWCGAYFVPKPGGTGRVRKYVYGRTRKEVYDKLTVISRSVRDGVPVPVGGQTVEAYLAEWLAQVAAVRVRPSTLRSYDLNVRLHIVPRIGRRQLGKLTARDVRQMLDDMRGDGAGPGLSSTCTRRCGSRWSTRSGRSCCRATSPSWSRWRRRRARNGSR